MRKMLVLALRERPQGQCLVEGQYQLTLRPQQKMRIQNSLVRKPKIPG